MLDQFSEQIMQILNLSICGVSLATILANVIYCIRSIRRAAKEAKRNKEDVDKRLEVSKEQIEEAFKNAVLPSKIKLDISSKIEKPIKEGIEKMEENNKEYLQSVKEQNLLILKILSKFTHTKQLTEEEQEELKEIIGESKTEEVKL